MTGWPERGAFVVSMLFWFGWDARAWAERHRSLAFWLGRAILTTYAATRG